MDNNTHQETEQQGTSSKFAKALRRVRKFLQKAKEFLFVKDGRIRPWRSFFFGAFIVLMLAIHFPHMLPCFTTETNVIEMGPYGDIYGGLNTFFTGLALVGLLITIFLQNQEMRETRKEFEEQTNLMLRQNINSCMFEQLKYMHNIKQDIAAKNKQLLSKLDMNIDGVLKICKNIANDSEVPLSKAEIETINEVRRSVNVMSTWCSIFTSWCMRINRVVGSSQEELRSKEEYVQAYWDLMPPDDKFLIFMQYVLYGSQEKEIKNQLRLFFENTPYIYNLLLIKGFDEQTFKLFYHLIHKIPNNKSYSVDLERQDMENIVTKFKSKELCDIDLFDKKWETHKVDKNN